jgi:hypothetical protein
MRVALSLYAGDRAGKRPPTHCVSRMPAGVKLKLSAPYLRRRTLITQLRLSGRASKTPAVATQDGVEAHPAQVMPIGLVIGYRGAANIAP